MKKYKKKLKQFTKEGFIEIINKSSSKSECLDLLSKYTERNKHTIRKWISKYNLLKEYNKLYNTSNLILDGHHHRKIKQEELDYWQEIANISSSFKEIYQIHSTKNKGFKKRSEGTLRKYLKLSFALSVSERKKIIQKEKEERLKEKIKNLSFIETIQSYDLKTKTGYETVSFICNNGHREENRNIRNLTGCHQCYLENLKIETKRKRNKEKNIKRLQKESKLIKRSENVKNFFESKSWKNYSCIKEWPIKNDILVLRKHNKFEYEYDYNYVSYFEYKATSAVPPVQPNENHFYCRHCKEEKPITESRGTTEAGNPNNICIPCTLNYRRENFLEGEKEKQREKYHSDPVYRFGSIMTTHIWNVLKQNGKIKEKKWKDIVGLSKKQFVKYIFDKLEPNWNMDNYGKEWVIQHIIPRSWAENMDDAHLVNYYKNLIPWGFSDNVALSNRVLPSQLNEWHYNNKRIKELLDKRKSFIIT